MKKYDVVCVGFAVQDIVMQGIPEDALKQDSVHARKTMVASGGDAVNQGQSEVHASLHKNDFRPHPGGKTCKGT